MREVPSNPVSCLLFGLALASCGGSSGSAIAPRSVESTPPEAAAVPVASSPRAPAEAPPVLRSTLAQDIERVGVGHVFVFVPADTPLFAAASLDSPSWARTTRRTAFIVDELPDAGFVRVALFPTPEAALTTGICARPSGVSTSLPMALSLYVPVAALEIVVHDPLDYRAPNGDRVRAVPGTPFSSRDGSALLLDEARNFTLSAAAAHALSLGDSLTCEDRRCARTEEPGDRFAACFLPTTLTSLETGFGSASFDGGVIRAEASNRAVLRGSCVLADVSDAPALAPWTCGGVADDSHSTQPGVLMGAPMGGSFGPSGLGLSGTGRGPEPSSTTHAPRVALLPPDDVTGGLSREQVQRVTRRHLGAIRQCYAEALATDATAQGRVLVEFTIAFDGTVSTARVVQRTLTTASVDTCITGTVRGWVFPAPDGGGRVVVRQPFDFQPAGQPVRPVMQLAAGTDLVSLTGDALGSVTEDMSLELDAATSTESLACFRVPLANASAEPPAVACVAR